MRCAMVATALTVTALLPVFLSADADRLVDALADKDFSITTIPILNKNEISPTSLPQA